MPINTVRCNQVFSSLIVAGSLVACANPPTDPDHGRHHSEQSANAAVASDSASAAHGGMAGGATAAGQAGSEMMNGSKTESQVGCEMKRMDKDAMCAMYRTMRDAPNEQARMAMMDRNMQGMSAEMRDQHMEMMRQQCQ